MSFLKITDPVKRDFIVAEYLKTKKNIQQNFLSERLGDIGLQRELSKLYKPITETQSEMTKQLEAIKETTAATATALQELPTLKPIQFPQYPSIKAFDDEPDESDRTLELGLLATEYLKQYASNKKSVDTTFGINSKDGSFYIGDRQITIKGDDVAIDHTVYKGTPGLWELITMAKPDNTIYDSSDLETYAEILERTNAMSQPSNPKKPKSSKSEKYTQIIKPLWNRMLGLRSTASSGKGVNTVILPQDPNALVEMLTLRIASYQAGNTGVRNEIISKCDELRRQKQISAEEYKKIIILI